ncbi:MAG TPA: hypothetical protein DCR39_05615 [Nitrospiraceae bacterium]|nr:hypothetical protein [Nitrospiraceae bacterium]
MTLSGVLKEREKKRMALREDALKEVRRLVSLLSERYKFESIYIYGSILSERFARHSDIDMVIKGLKVSDFFKAHAYLIKESLYNIDLKPFEDLSEDFKKKVISGGSKIG